MGPDGTGWDRMGPDGTRGRAHDPSPRPEGSAQQEPFARHSRENDVLWVALKSYNNN